MPYHEVWHALQLDIYDSYLPVRKNQVSPLLLLATLKLETYHLKKYSHVLTHISYNFSCWFVLILFYACAKNSTTRLRLGSCYQQSRSKQNRNNKLRTTYVINRWDFRFCQEVKCIRITLFKLFCNIESIDKNVLTSLTSMEIAVQKLEA